MVCLTTFSEEFDVDDNDNNDGDGAEFYRKWTKKMQTGVEIFGPTYLVITQTKIRQD